MSDHENDVVEDGGSVRRSSRKGSSRLNNKMSAFEQLKQARKAGHRRIDLDELDKDLYEEVDEDTYNERVRQLQNDNFIVDDDGSGYVDHGEDMFEEEEFAKSKKAKKEKKEKPKKDGIGKFFSNVSATTKRVKDDAAVKLENDDELNDILAEMEDGGGEEEEMEVAAPTSNPFDKNRKRDRTESPVIAPRPIKASRLSLGLAAKPRQNKIELVKKPEPVKQRMADFSDDDMAMPMSPSQKQIKEEQAEEEKEQTVEEKEQTVEQPAPKKEVKEEAVSPAKPRPAKKEELTTTEWETAEESDSPAVECVAGEEAFYVTLPDGRKAVRMYWLDAYEDAHRSTGTVYLFGRVDCGGGRSASCCVVAKNIQRQVFFLPRETIESTGEPVSVNAVFAEAQTVLKQQLGIANFKCKPSRRSFMHDGTLGEEAGERTADVLEVQYDGAASRLSADLSGSTFSHVYNTTTTCMERLLTEREMAGPGWIDCTGYVEPPARCSYCEYEFVVDMESMKGVQYNKAMKEERAPPARMFALNVITALNKDRENEIVMVSGLFNPRCHLDVPSTETKHLERFCLVAKPSAGQIPFDLKDKLNRAGLSSMVQVTANEKALLSLLLTRLQKMDPDVYLGHDMAGMMQLLIGRMEKLKVANWSRTSRLRRTATLSKVGHGKSAQWEWTAGRLMVDSRLSAMELVRSRSFDLHELAHSLLAVDREEIYANEIAAKFNSSALLVNLIGWSWTDPLLSLRIIAKLNALPLALQITNIVGGVLSRTLMGGRAERNEFLLMHAFNKAGFVAPDKHQFQKKAGKKEKCEEGKDEGGSTGPSKAQYSGGLVLDPKKGLYDTLILLLDFNSLYPSIIQEYNICFTTVRHVKDGDEIPDVPSSSLPEGILPKEIRGLVEKRRAVKGVLKDKGLSEEKRKQLDIRQMAYKLTANSMYGCLGFQQSRFYAKPLAALVTSKGREILMHSKDLVEKMGYCVVYGDTDSIMINTNSTDLQMAKKLGNEIKKQVNACHRLLELDLDGVFSRMLLLKKKKYAALTVNPDDETDVKKELKGLDIVRRDWSLVAKEAGTEVVDLLLDPSLSREEMVSAVHDSLTRLRGQLDRGELPVEKFQILKQLTRNPSEYQNAGTQPHAAVAMRLNHSGKFHLRSGDIVEYVICEDGTDNSAIQRAYHRTEMEGDDKLKIDLQYYLAQQIHPVVSRLCEPIEETDAVRIAEALGMDGTGYRRAAIMRDNMHAGDDEAWRVEETYEHCESLRLRCPGKDCPVEHLIREAVDAENGRLWLEQCGKCGVSLPAYSNYIENQLESALAECAAQFHQSAFKCDDPVCGFRTHYHGLKWNKEGLECPKCFGGVMRREYPAKMLFDQQMLWKKVLDLPTAIDQLPMDKRRALSSRPAHSDVVDLCEKLVFVVERHLARNDYNRIDLAFLFAPMLHI